MTYATFPRFGNKPVSPDIVTALRRVDPAVRLMMKNHISQGAGGARLSNGTHSTGHSIDLRTSRMSNDQIRLIDKECKRIGAAPVLRLKGDDLGGGVRNTTEHLHIPFPGGSSNYEAVRANSNSPLTRNWIEKQLAKRKVY